LLALLVTPRGAAMPGICSVTFHRLDADGLEGAPDEFTGLYEDQCLIAILLAHRPACVTNECLAKYRIHSESATQRASVEHEGPSGCGSAEYRYLQWLTHALAERGVSYGPLSAALRARMFLYESPALKRAADVLGDSVASARAAAVHWLRTHFDDRRFEILRRVREARRRRRVRRGERALRAHKG
jgi:hypothetical protein